jgi:O-antigen ligase
MHTKIHLYLCMLIAFLLPVYIQATPPVIVLLLVNRIAEGNFRSKWFELKNTKIVWTLIILYILHIIGMLWTENKSAGWFDLEVKLSLILFPFIIASQTNKQEYYAKTLWSFVWGCIISGIICYSVAGLHYINTGENHFAYTYFSYNMHPSYLAMYMVFSIAVILFLKQDKTRKTQSINVIMVLFLFTTVIILASKSGIVTLFLLLLIYLLYLSIKQNKTSVALSFLAVFILLATTIFYISPYTKQRIDVALKTLLNSKKINSNTKESNAERILIWKSDLATIQKNIPLGSGTGDIKDELIQTYLQYNYTDLAKKNLNAHNQFFQTAITLGLAGIIAIIACFTIPLYIGFRSKNIILLSFIIITIINFSVESMLEVQAGTIFFSFFYVLLLKHNTSPT